MHDEIYSDAPNENNNEKKKNLTSYDTIIYLFSPNASGDDSAHGGGGWIPS